MLLDNICYGIQASHWPEEGARWGPQNLGISILSQRRKCLFSVSSSRAKIQAKFDHFSWDTLKREFVVAT